MRFERPPYWFWRLDRWKLLLALLLALALILMALRGCGAPQPKIITPTFSAPSAGAQLTQGALGDATGAADPGGRVRIFDGDALLGETTADSNGAFRLALPALTPGAHSLVARSYDRKGGLLASSLPLAFTVVAAAPKPVTPVFTAPANGAALPAGALGELAGTAAPGATVRFFDGDKLLGEAVAGPDGKWRFALPALAAGAHTLTAQVFGADGKLLSKSDPLNITVTAAPAPTATEAPPTPAPTTPAPTATKAPPTPAAAPPAFTAPASGSQLVSGALGSLAGTAAPGATVRIYDGDKLLGEAVAGADGKWQFALPALLPGEHRLAARVTGPDGRVLEAAPIDLSVLSAAEVPVIDLPTSGSVVRSGQPIFAGRAGPNRTIRLLDGDIFLGETGSGAAGAWALRSAIALAAAEHSVTAVSLGPDGKNALRSQPVSFRLVAAAGPGLTTPVTGTAAPGFLLPSTGSTVSTTFPLFSGTATPNSVVRLYDGTRVIGEALADADGRWLFVPSAALAEGTHTITAVVLNADGSEGTARSTLSLRVAVPGQVTLPAPVLTTAIPAALANSRPALAGLGTPGTTVRIYDGDKLLGETTVAADGRWYFVPPTPLAPGQHTLRIEALAADGKTAAGAPITFKVLDGATALQPPTIKLPTGGQLLAGDALVGAAAPGSTVHIYDGDIWLGSATAGPDGSWRFVLPRTLRLGQHTLRAVVLAADGTALTASVAVVVTVGPPQVLPVTGAATGAPR